MSSWSSFGILGIIATVSVGLSGGCVEEANQGSERAAVHGGVAPTFSGVGSVVCGTSWEEAFHTGGVFLTKRHFMFLRGSEPCPSEDMRIFLDHPYVIAPPPNVISSYETPAVLLRGGEASMTLVISLLKEDADIAPATLASTSPQVDDALTVVGYGADYYDEPLLTEGAFRVSAVAADGSDFTLEPVGDVLLCLFDSAILNDGGELVGLSAYGPLDDNGCFPTTTALDLALHQSWINETLDMSPDTEPSPTTDDGGCTVGSRGPQRGTLALFFAVALLAWRRRR